MAMAGRPEGKGKTLNAFLVGEKHRLTALLALKNIAIDWITDKCAATSPVCE